MNSRNSLSQEFLTLPRRIIDSEFIYSAIIRPEFIELIRQRSRDSRAAQCREAFDLRPTNNGYDSWNDRHSDPQLASKVITEFKEVAIIEEQLRDDEIGARIDLPS